jgi:hypothetical protein
VTENKTINARTGDIEVTIGGMKNTIPVSQVGVPVYVNAPNPASIENVIAAGETGKTFTIATNAPDNSITVTTTNPSWITNRTPSRSGMATDGSFTWTIAFNVAANTTTSTRTGDIEVTIGGIKKTIPVLQVAMYVNNPSTASFSDLPVVGATGKSFTIATNAPDNSITVTTTNPSLITNRTPSRSAVAADGSSTWTIAFNVTENKTTSARTGDIEVTIGGIKKTVSVSQVGVPVYVNEPSTASFGPLPIAGATGRTFTIATNAPDNSITVTTTNSSLITNLTPSRSAVAAADGSFIWTIRFDVAANTVTSARSGNIDVTIGGIMKTVSVSQAALYVNNPSTASFLNLAVAGATGKTFTVTTNALDNDITVTTTNSSLITNLTKSRSAVAADGSYIWTIGFNVPVNTTTSVRTGNIEFTIGGIKKTVSVSQVALYVNNPSTASFLNLAVAGATGKTFTIATNAPDNDITVTPTNSSLITNLTKTRSAVAADGSSTWTIGFNVAANTEAYARSGNIEVTIGGMKKTVSVSQIAMYVNAPSTASFGPLPIAGATGRTFTIETNSTATVPTSLEATDESIITNLKAERSVKNAASGIYLWTVTFNVSANTTHYVRTASISINIGGVWGSVSVSQEDVPRTLLAPSNCYIVTPGNEIYIPVSRANEHKPNAIGANDAFTAELVWTDTSGLLAELTTYSVGRAFGEGVGPNGAIKVRTADKAGNALVAVKVGGVIKWSWHIWVTNYNPSANLFNPHSYGGNTTRNVQFMDRNLGAMGATNSPPCRGLLYQWGRKDPFPSFVTTVANIQLESLDTAIQNPSTFYWIKTIDDWLLTPNHNLWGGVTGVKTIYDPCPIGFKVPLSGEGTASPWSGFPTNQSYPNGNGDTAGKTWGTSYWPATGGRTNTTDGLHKNEGYSGEYWSATAVVNVAQRSYYFSFIDAPPVIDRQGRRRAGFAVRCVKE